MSVSDSFRHPILSHPNFHRNSNFESSNTKPNIESGETPLQDECINSKPPKSQTKGYNVVKVRNLNVFAVENPNYITILYVIDKRPSRSDDDYDDNDQDYDDDYDNRSRSRSRSRLYYDDSDSDSDDYW